MTDPTATIDGTVAQLRRFVVECAELRELERSLSRFNVFDVLKSAQSELRHSNMLAWLLDPAGSHGLGELFLRRWFMAVLNSAPERQDGTIPDVVEMDTEPFEHVELDREWRGIDVLVRISTKKGEWVIVIENKVNSIQGKDQLAKYRRLVEHTFPDAKRMLLFLTRFNEPPDDDQYLTTTYSTVLDTLTYCLNEGSDLLNEGPRYLLEQYQHLLHARFMETSNEEELARKIYAKYKVALDYIYKQIPNQMGAVGELVGKSFTNAGVWTRATNPVVFLPKQWNTEKNWAPNKWPYVCFEVRIEEKRAILKAYVRQELRDDAWRNRIFLVAKEKGWLKFKVSKPGATWFIFYSRPIAMLSTDASPEEIAEVILAAVDRELQERMVGEMINEVLLMLGDIQSSGGTEPYSNGPLTA